MQSAQTFQPLRQIMWFIRWKCRMSIFSGEAQRWAVLGCQQSTAGEQSTEVLAQQIYFQHNIQDFRGSPSQSGQHFGAWQDHYRRDKLVDLWRISPISLHVNAALDCLSNPVLPFTDMAEHLPVIINRSGQQAGTCSLVFGQRSDKAVWTEC